MLEETLGRIQKQQRAAAGEPREEFGTLLGTRSAQAPGLPEDRENRCGVLQPLTLNEPDLALKFGKEVLRHLACQAGLAHAAEPHHRHQAHAEEQTGERGSFSFAADKLRPRER